MINTDITVYVSTTGSSYNNELKELDIPIIVAKITIDNNDTDYLKKLCLRLSSSITVDDNCISISNKDNPTEILCQYEFGQHKDSSYEDSFRRRYTELKIVAFEFIITNSRGITSLVYKASFSDNKLVSHSFTDKRSMYFRD